MGSSMSEWKQGFDALVTELKGNLAQITDGELAIMEPHEREFVLRQRAAIYAFEHGDSATLERMIDEAHAKLTGR
jgi:hypothetical protein